jgi:hypothetical protein
MAATKKKVKSAKKKQLKKKAPSSKKPAKKNKASKTVGSIDAYFSNSLGRNPIQDGNFGVVSVGGPTIGTSTPLPPGELILFFSFIPTAKHQGAATFVKVKTAGPFALWNGYTSPPVLTKSQTLTLSSEAAANCYIVCRPKKAGPVKGTLTVSTKDVTLTGPFRNKRAFKLKATSN